ncbi:MAG TPA: hypothetical protein PLS90_02590 [Candidatus Sumerlaeota bacterium]|nr:MAG: hypothetical protein BWZ08_00723 [candidate division BRC1 bacterium ADurb.BinA292]HPK01322.1 hypothetical protein [Candidatus Sumerlaeota bacterium]
MEPGVPRTDIQRLYEDKIRQMPPHERVERATRMHELVVSILRQQLRAKHPELSEREISWKIAERMNWRKKRALELNRQVAEHEP